jgi:hypothetical protein
MFLFCSIVLAQIFCMSICIKILKVFQKTAELERIRKSTCLKANGKALYLDELDPKAGNHKDLQLPDCGLFCELEQV